MIHSYMKSTLLVAAVSLLAACGESATDKKASDDAGAAATSVVEAAKEVTESQADTPAGSGYRGDIVFGDPNAPAEIMEYASFTCGACMAFHTRILPDVKEKLLDTGKAKLVFRNLIRDRLDLAAASVTRCSTEPVAKKLLDRFFTRQQEWVSSDDQVGALAAIARGIGLSRTDFDRCLQDRSMHEFLVEMTKGGSEKGVTGTPTVFVNNEKLNNYGFEAIAKAVEDAQ